MGLPVHRGLLNVLLFSELGSVVSNPYETPLSPGQGAGPGPVHAHPPGPKPENYLVQSILITLCCCLPLGIVAIVFSAQVDSKWSAGDYAGAIEASENAKKWGWIAFGLGIAGIVLWLVFYFFMLAVGMNV